MQLVLDTNGLIVKKRNHCFYIISKKHRRMISPYLVDTIAVTADCLLSTAAIKLAVENDIPIMFFSKSGRPEARMWRAYVGKEAGLRRKQVLYANSLAASEETIDVFNRKGTAQIELLKSLQAKGRPVSNELLQRMQIQLEKAQPFVKQPLDTYRASLLGIEGNLSKLYWKGVSAALPPDWQFKKRRRRPSLDPFNAVLNYSYGMLYGVVEGAIFGAGLDAQLGIFHVDEWNQPTLSFDLIEPFRPWVDENLIQFYLTNKFNPHWFVNKGKGLWLSKSGKGIFIPLFNSFIHEHIEIEGYRASRKNQIHRFVGQFAKRIKQLDTNT